MDGEGRIEGLLQAFGVRGRERLCGFLGGLSVVDAGIWMRRKRRTCAILCCVGGDWGSLE
jgi:hypothetical protein